MITWGCVGNSHDASLAVFENDELQWASLAKEFSGVQNDPHLNPGLLTWAQASSGPPDRIIWYERPFVKTIRQLIAGQGWLMQENNIEHYFKERGIKCPRKIEYSQHHHSHAAYAYYTQEYENCAVICLDSIGEFETLTIWHGNNGKLKKIYSQNYPHSLGLFYSAMTQRIGLTPQRDEHLLVSYADKGDIQRFSACLQRDLLDYKLKHLFVTKENLHRGCLWWRPELNSQQDLYDIAAATQFIFESALRDLSRFAFRETDAIHLALAGGGALNARAVDKIKSDWESVWVPPNPGDPGSCIGAVLAKQQQFINVDSKWYKAV